ncbi:MFS transporter [Kribbella antibiotica]|uniref:MFS transporter n=1 Tax=Kribbella antibiotica TaxID=190195 RepID=A0A4R4ZVS3_9ACTN|nr:MFS transporter [Kribbella antibiotica]TDD62324.1 MFS transporter [Kribbella antibiotica]
MSLGPDFRRLRFAYAVSALGSGIGFGALPLIAVLVLDVSTLQVSMLAAVSALAGAVLALPMGDFIERRHKRPVMIAADLIRFAALLSVPVAAAFGVLSYPQLCVVGVLQMAALIAFTSASGAHLKTLVGPEGRAEANGKFEQVFWLTMSAGPAIGGGLVSLVGAPLTLVVDAVSFLLSALGIRRIRQPEPTPAEHTGKRDLAAGWKYIFANRGLAVLFVNAQLFGGPLMMVSPLLTVFMLRELHLAPWSYGVFLGVSCLGGVLGAWIAPALTRRFGLHRMLLWFGVLRTPWTLLLPLAPSGMAGFVWLLVAETALLVAAGAFNPSFATYRMEVTDDSHMARVLTSWSITSRSVQPAFIALGGVLTAVLGLRGAMYFGGAVALLTAAILPWKSAKPAPLPEPV